MYVITSRACDCAAKAINKRMARNADRRAPMVDIGTLIHEVSRQESCASAFAGQVSPYIASDERDGTTPIRHSECHAATRRGRRSRVVRSPDPRASGYGLQHRLELPA